MERLASNPQAGTGDIETSVQEMNAISELGGLGLRWHDGTGVFALKSVDIFQVIKAGRSVLIHGHASMLQTARLKFTRVRVLETLDYAKVEAQAQVRKTPSWPRCWANFRLF